MSRFSSRLRSGRALPLAAALAASGSGLAYYTLSPNRVAHADGAPKIDLGLRATPTSDLVRSWVVYKICQFPMIVDNSPVLLETFGNIPVLKQITQFVVRYTFFGQFVGGDTASDCMPVIQELRRREMGTILNYSVEVSHEESESAGGAAAAVVGADGMTANRRAAEARVLETIDAIEVSGVENKKVVQASGGKEVGSTWLALKLTGLMAEPGALQRAASTVLAMRQAKPDESTSTYYPGTPSDYELALISRATTPAQITLPNIPDGVRPEDFQELETLYQDMRRILRSAASNGVRILIDSEHSWFQPAIDSFTAILSQEFNQLPKGKSTVEKLDTDYPATQPLVYGTYQSYLRRNIPHMRHALAHAKANNYAIGFKLVRGAYHGQETSRWHALGLPGPEPVWSTKPDTDHCFNDSVEMLMDLIAADVYTKGQGGAPTVAALFGTHNAESASRVIAGLKKRGLATEIGMDDPVNGGKLIVDDEARKRVAIGQLFGMCDDLTSSITAAFVPNTGSPMAFKYMPFGALEEVMPYLGRRAVENKSVLADGGAVAESNRAARELKRRWFGINYD